MSMTNELYVVLHDDAGEVIWEMDTPLPPGGVRRLSLAAPLVLAFTQSVAWGEFKRPTAVFNAANNVHHAKAHMLAVDTVLGVLSTLADHHHEAVIINIDRIFTHPEDTITQIFKAIIEDQ